MIILFIFIFGLVFGSFLEALTYRIPRDISIANGRSFCPKCKNQIGWFDNIPLLSYVLLHGKCRSCTANIPVRAPLIEMFTGLLFVTIFLLSLSFQDTVTSFYIERLGYMALPYLGFISVLCVAIFVVDLEHKIIPDELLFPLFFVASFVLIFFAPEKLWINLFTSFSISLFFLVLHVVTKGRGMGLGDVKFVLFPPLFLGWPMSFYWLTFSFFLGALIGIILIFMKQAKFGREIPFAPFLLIGFFVTMFLSQKLFLYF